MPHQCLKCGKVFEEGSQELLKGCQSCGGNRFFYTKVPLDEKKRNQIIKEVGNDINSVIVELMGSEGKELIDGSGEWADIKPKDIKKAMKKHLSEKKKESDKKEDIKEITDEKVRESVIEKIKSEVDKSDVPETIDIEKSGSYKIDLKGLLEEEPIIIQKDGSYTIHLPSIFKMIEKEKN